MEYPNDPLINVVDPDTQEIGSIPAGQLQEALTLGYQKASPEQVETHFKEKEFSTPGQQLATAVEGLASGATLHASEPISVALGLTTPERIEARKEVNPGISAVSEIAGLGGSLFLAPGASAAKALTSAGELGASAIGLAAPTSIIGKVGSAAVKGAIENGIYQGTDETAKMLMGDPNQSVETALVNTGLASFLGAGVSGAIGSVNPIWKATMSDKLGTWLETVHRRMNGEMAPLPENIRGALRELGDSADIYPTEVRGAVQGTHLADEFNNLIESRTASGLKTKEQLGQFQKDASEYIATALGKDPAELLSKGEISHFEAGEKIRDALADNVKKYFEPISEEWNKISQSFGDIPIGSEADIVADKLADVAEREGWLLIKDSPQAKLYNSVMDGLTNVTTLEDMRKFISNVWSTAKSDPSALFYPARQITNQLEDVLNNTYLSHAGAKGGEFLEKFSGTKEAYKIGKNLIEELNDRLHVGRYGGPDTFVKALREMSPETVVSRLSKVNDAGLLNLLKRDFPEIGNMVKDYALNRAVGPAVTRAAEGHALNAKAFFGALDNMSPELRQFVLPEGSEAKLGAIRTLLDSVPKYQSSRTAANLDKLWEKVPGTALAGVAMIFGHNPVLGWVVGNAAKWAARDAPDAARLAMLKFLGSDAPIEAKGFKAMLDFANTVRKGERTLSQVTTNVFLPGRQVLPSRLIFSDDETKKLEKKIEELKKDPNPMLEAGGDIAHYGVEYSQGIAQTSANAVQLLSSLKPKAVKQNPLDNEPKLNPFQEAQYKQALKIAQSPLTTLQSVKDGTITPQDVITFKNLYPSLYQRTAQKLFDTMSDQVQKGNAIPYSTRLGLSLFLGQPLDSTMTPEGIMGAQPMSPNVPMPPMPPMPKGMGKPTATGMGKLTPLGKVSMTSDQGALYRTMTQRN